MKPRQPPFNDLPQELLDIAFEWRARFDDAKLETADRLAFQQWLRADIKHEMAFDQADRFWDASDRLRSAIPVDEVAALQRPSYWRARLSSPLLRIWSAAAALVLLVLALPGLRNPAPENTKPQVVRLETELGDVGTFTLADGSTLFLGAASAADIVFSNNHRLVSLIKGDAFFSVASDQSRPFVVEADNLKVRAVGTAFDVRCSGEIKEVAVAEGAVAVSLSPAGAPDPALAEAAGALEAELLLNAGQRVEVSAEHGLGAARAVRGDRIGAWRRDRLVFQDAPISEIAADLNRYLKDPLLVEDDTVAAITLSATVGADDLESFLATLTDMFPIDLQRRADGARLMRSRPE